MVSIPNNLNIFLRSRDKHSLGYPGEPISENQHGGRSSGGQIKIRSDLSGGRSKKIFQKILFSHWVMTGNVFEKLLGTKKKIKGFEIYEFLQGGNNQNSFKTIPVEQIELRRLLCVGNNRPVSFNLRRNRQNCATQNASEQIELLRLICFGTDRTAPSNVRRK